MAKKLKVAIAERSFEALSAFNTLNEGSADVPAKKCAQALEAMTYSMAMSKHGRFKEVAKLLKELSGAYAVTSMPRTYSWKMVYNTLDSAAGDIGARNSISRGMSQIFGRATDNVLRIASGKQPTHDLGGQYVEP